MHHLLGGLILLLCAQGAHGANPWLESRTQCTAGQNDYFKKYFPDGIPKDPRHAEYDEKLGPQCFRQAMLKAGKAHINLSGLARTSYVRCDIAEDPQGFGKDTLDDCNTKDCALPPACITDGMVNALRNTFLDAAKCVGVDPVAWFPLLVQESRFQINLRNNTGTRGAWGLGQTLGSSLLIWDRYKRLEGYSGKPECAKFQKIIDESLARSSVIKKNGAWKHRPCDFLQPEDYAKLPGMGIDEKAQYTGSPARALLYSADMFKRNYRLGVAWGGKGKPGKVLGYALYNAGNFVHGMYADYTKAKKEKDFKGTFYQYMESSDGPDGKRRAKWKEVQAHIMGIFNNSPCH